MDHADCLSPRTELIGEDCLRRLARCDICVVDLDQCLFPGFSHTRLGQILTLRILLNPRRWSLLPRLLRGGLFIVGVRLRQLTGRRASVKLLMTRFDRHMRGLPYPLVSLSARWLPYLAFPAWRETLGELARRMPVCLLSWAVDPIVAAFAGQRDRNGRRIFSLTFGNSVDIKSDGDHACITRCWSDKGRHLPHEKTEILRRWMDRLGAKRPLVIGHGQDELPMAALARRAGGVSIGVNPDPHRAAQFDIVLRQWTWRPLCGLVRRALSDGHSRNAVQAVGD